MTKIELAMIVGSLSALIFMGGTWYASFKALSEACPHGITHCIGKAQATIEKEFKEGLKEGQR